MSQGFLEKIFPFPRLMLPAPTHTVIGEPWPELWEPGGSNPGSCSNQTCDLEHLVPILAFSFINDWMNYLNLIFLHSRKESWIILCGFIPKFIIYFQGTELIFIIFWPPHKFFSILFLNEDRTGFTLEGLLWQSSPCHA